MVDYIEKIFTTYQDLKKKIQISKFIFKKISKNFIGGKNEETHST